MILKEILCGLSWYQKHFENLALAPGFAGECHIWSNQKIKKMFVTSHGLKNFIILIQIL